MYNYISSIEIPKYMLILTLASFPPCRLLMLVVIYCMGIDKISRGGGGGGVLVAAYVVLLD